MLEDKCVVIVTFMIPVNIITLHHQFRKLSTLNHEEIVVFDIKDMYHDIPVVTRLTWSCLGISGKSDE